MKKTLKTCGETHSPEMDIQPDVGMLSEVQEVDKRQRLEVCIRVTSQSKLQEYQVEQMINAATSAIADVHKSRHPKNDLEVVIKKITPPHNEAEAQLRT